MEKIIVVISAQYTNALDVCENLGKLKDSFESYRELRKYLEDRLEVDIDVEWEEGELESPEFYSLEDFIVSFNDEHINQNNSFITCTNIKEK